MSRKLTAVLVLGLLLSTVAYSAEFPDEPVKGQQDAPVTIVLYEDMQCPFCKRLEQNTMPSIVKQYVETGKAKLVWKDFPLKQIHPWSDDAAAAMECVYRKGGDEAFWAVKDKVFDNQESITTENVEDKIVDWAEHEGVSATVLRGCIANDNPMQEVERDKQDGKAKGVSGTPTVFINDEKLVGAQPFSRFQTVIENQLADGGSYDPANGTADETADDSKDKEESLDDGPQHTIELGAGWNMISVPLATDISSITDDCSLRPYKQHKVWTYDGEGWNHPTRLQNERGYYVYSTESCTATVTGETDAFSGISLNKGWNMISADRKLADIKGTCSFKPYQGETIWRMAAGSWQHPSSLSDTGGYFVYAQQDCDLGIPAPTVPGQ